MLLAQEIAIDVGTSGLHPHSSPTETIPSPTLCPPSSSTPLSAASESAQLLHRIAELHIRPSAVWVASQLASMQPALADMTGDHLSGTLWALAVWGYQPDPKWLDTFEAAVVMHLSGHSTRQSWTGSQLANVVWGLACLGLSRPRLVSSVLGAAFPRLPTCTPEVLVHILHSAAKLGHNPGEAWVDAYLTASLPQLQDFSPQQLACVWWALARLPHRPTGKWVNSFLKASFQLLPKFDTKSLSLTVWALATLGCTPGAKWLAAFENQMRLQFSAFTAAELACVMWALHQLGDATHPDTCLGSASASSPARGPLGGSGDSMESLAFGLQASSSTSHPSSTTGTGNGGILGAGTAPAGEGRQPQGRSVLDMLHSQDSFNQFDFDVLQNPELLNVMRSLAAC